MIRLREKYKNDPQKQSKSLNFKNVFLKKLSTLFQVFKCDECLFFMHQIFLRKSCEMAEKFNFF
jgi:hypothetical protein